jgi:hypothetical protein
MTEYKVIGALTTYVLEKEVEKYLNDNYVLIGGVIVVSHENQLLIFQAMAR